MTVVASHGKISHMRLTYDPEANAAYVYLVDEINRGEVARSAVSGIELEEAAIVVDFDDQGQILGIELLNARQLLRDSVLDQAR